MHSNVLDEDRLRQVRELELLDTEPELVFDQITRLAAKLMDSPVAFVSLLDERRQWFKSRIGLQAQEVPLNDTVCVHTLEENETLVIEDASGDSRFNALPAVREAGGIRAYAGVPLRGPGGAAVGTLCVADRRVRRYSATELESLEALASQVELELALRHRLLAERRERSRRDADDVRRAELTTAIVHDLKGPLASILTNARYVASHPLPDEAREAIEDVHDAARRLSSMALDLLDLERRGAMPLRREVVDLAELAGRVITANRRRLSAANLITEVLVSRDARPVHADAGILRRVLENLLDNAIKHAGAGALTLEVEAPRGSMQPFLVRDCGRGIPEAVREAIFSRGVGGGDGHGLGLAFCRLAIAAHGGQIVAEANQPRGTTFRVELPVA